MLCGAGATALPVAFKIWISTPILGCLARSAEAVPYVVGLYITSCYWFTASTSFANPAVTIARSFSDTSTGMAPAGVAAFIVAQLAGMLAAVIVSRWLWRERKIA